jgi:hypothetical protein
VFPPRLERVGDGLFQFCSSVVHVDASKSKLSLLPHFFCSDCSSLTLVKLPPTLVNFGGGEDRRGYQFAGTAVREFDASSFSWRCIPSGMWVASALVWFLLPSSVVSIGPYAFCGAGLAGDFVGGASLSWIGVWAFCACRLRRVRLIRRAVVGREAFAACSRLEHFACVGAVFGRGVFADCGVLADVLVRGADANGMAWSPVVPRADFLVECEGSNSRLTGPAAPLLL